METDIDIASLCRRVLSDAMTWVESAHDVTGRLGVSAGYHLVDGWLPCYPETSGYLIYTMRRAATVLRRPVLGVRSVEIGRWLQSLQSSDGAFPGGMGVDGPPVVFDVGQIVLGLLALWRDTKDGTLLESAARAGHWLARAQQEDGSWRSHLGAPNTYSSRVTWAVAELWKETGETAHRACARLSATWLLTQSQPDGWIDRMSFGPDRPVWTHNIGYTLRGLMRAGEVLGDDLGMRCVSVADQCATRLAGVRSPLDPLLPGELGPGFASSATYACLTGDAQMVTVWLDLARRCGDVRLRERCIAVLTALADLQVRQALEPAAVGSLPGSWPLAGGFEPLTFPSWSTKFLADAALALLDDSVSNVSATANREVKN